MRALETLDAIGAPNRETLRSLVAQKRLVAILMLMSRLVEMAMIDK